MLHWYCILCVLFRTVCTHSLLNCCVHSSSAFAHGFLRYFRFVSFASKIADVCVPFLYTTIAISNVFHLLFEYVIACNRCSMAIKIVRSHFSFHQNRSHLFKYYSWIVIHSFIAFFSFFSRLFLIFLCYTLYNRGPTGKEYRNWSVRWEMEFGAVWLMRFS